EPKHGDRRAVHGHPVVTSVPTHNLTQPCAHHGDRLVQPSLQLGFHLTELRLHPLPDRLPHHREPSTPLLPADVREAEEVERLRFPFSAPLPARHRARSELQKARLVGMRPLPARFARSSSASPSSARRAGSGFGSAPKLCPSLCKMGLKD